MAVVPILSALIVLPLAGAVALLLVRNRGHKILVEGVENEEQMELMREFGVDGYVCRYEKHLIYWKLLEDGAVGIVTLDNVLEEIVGDIQDEFDRIRWAASQSIRRP